MTTIVIENKDTFVDDGELSAGASALDNFLQNDFLPVWGSDAVVGMLAPFQVRAANPSQPATPTEWLLSLHLEVDRPRTYGYHDKTAAGLPWMRIFPAIAENEGQTWEMAAAHELLETIVDPELDRWATLADGRTIALAVCDAVQKIMVPRNGVKLSDFVIPAYFGFAGPMLRGALDCAGLVHAQGEMLTQGYNQLRRGNRIEIIGDARARARLHRRGTRLWKRCLKNQPAFWRAIRCMTCQ